MTAIRSGRTPFRLLVQSAPMLAVLFVVGAVAVPTANADELTAKVDALFAKWDKPDSPGCALGVIRDGEFVYQRGYGSANLDYEIPISSKTVFYLASVSKQFAAASIALLAQEDGVSLDDDIRKHLPELPEYDDTITIRHLVHHTSGLKDYLTLMSVMGANFEDVHSIEEVLHVISRQTELNFPPGEKYLYSNTGYFLLGVIIKRVTGKSLREYADEKIFQPLGMQHTHFHDDRSMIVKHRAIGYSSRDDGGFEINDLRNFEMVGSGGLLSSVDDLLKWDQNFDHQNVGGQDFIETLHTRGRLNDGTTLDYAFGLSLGRFGGLKTVRHGGAMMGFRTHFIRFPEQRLTVVCLGNLAEFNPGSLAEQVAQLHLAEEFKQAADQYAGTYRNEELDTSYTLSVDDRALRAGRGNGPQTQLKAASGNDAFTVKGMKIEFERDDEDQITGFKVPTGRASAIRFARIEE